VFHLYLLLIIITYTYYLSTVMTEKHKFTSLIKSKL